MDLSLLPALVPEQEFLSCYVATVLGPIEYREWKSQLERIHEVLGLSRVEETFQRLSLAQRNQAEQRAAEKEDRPFYQWSPVEQESYQRLCSQALRCNVPRTLTGDSLRDFGCRLSDSGLLQWFCKLDRVGMVIRIPGKSALQRYGQWLPEAEMRKVIDTLLAAASDGKAEGERSLELASSLDLEAYFLDTTCVKLHIHFPVDWVLLRDAARTLMKATILIRKRSLKVRMEEPEEFLKRMNQLCMKMSGMHRRSPARSSMACCGSASCTISRLSGTRGAWCSPERITGSSMSRAGTCARKTLPDMGRLGRTRRSGPRHRPSSSWVDRMRRNSIILRRNRWS